MIRNIGPVTRLWERYILVLPALLALLIVAVYPFIFGLTMSLRGATLANFRTAPWVGLNNYYRLFGDRFFWNSLSFTVKFIVATVFFEMIFGTALALFFFLASFPAKRVLFVGMLTPLMIAPIFYGVSLKLAFNSLYGFIPWFLRLFGLQIDFFSTPRSAFWTMVGIDVWQWTSFVLLLVYAGLHSIPKETIEAATVDGAGWWQMIWRILLPQTLPVLSIAGLLRAIDAFKVFDTIYVITGGGPGVSTRSASLQIWYYMFAQFDLGKAAAYTTILAILVSFIAQVTVRKLIKT